MQGAERADRQLPDAAALVGHLAPAGSVFAFLAAHRREVFPAEVQHNSVLAKSHRYCHSPCNSSVPYPLSSDMQR
jgi:hypothetical protein